MIDALLRRRITRGTLTLRDASGEDTIYGSGEPRALVIFNTTGVLRRILRHPEFELGEAYLDGEWDTPDLLGLLEVLRLNAPGPVTPFWQRRLKALLKFSNGVVRSRRNVAVHYDLDEPLFRAFLDREMHYSCAYFRSPEDSLEDAQAAKAELIGRKLRLQPGQRVLDIGCGWGSLAMFLAARYDVEVTGLTLSQEQHRVACAEAKRRGLDGRVEFRLEDYREHAGSYDRVVSVGMFEHVGRSAYPVFFDLLRARLASGGIALLHTIGRPGPPILATNPWIERHIFPGGYIPSASEVIGPLERSGLVLCDLEVWRRHYAYTLHHWQQRFQAHRQTFAASKGERFCRLWEFYLAACESAFANGELEVFHFQLATDQDAVPLTRDYLYESSPVAEAPRADEPQRQASGGTV
ncbi:MAG: class I SAM-dependent methyltransferase [Gammaproteobacteria bacterium]|nr:class I SAM-dependent methyltransferase [Gammaproteobacteria bacterium]